MYYPNEKEFLKLAKKGNLIPVYKEILADLETPVSAYLKVSKNDDYSFLLESVEGQERVGRFSFLATNPKLIFKSKGADISIIDYIKKKALKFKTKTNPLDEIRKIMNRYRFVKLAQLPRFCGGFVGYIGYDCVRFFEKLENKTSDDLNFPDSLLMLAEDLLIFDHVQKTIKIICCAYVQDKSDSELRKAYKDTLGRIDHLHIKLSAKLKPSLKEARAQEIKDIKFSSNIVKKTFTSSVERAKQYIRAGDIIQVVLSQRFSMPVKCEPLTVYRNLRSINPSPYMFFLKLKDLILVGSSPEMLVRCEDSFVQTRPIAGTRPRGQNEAQDERLKQELLNDPKEKCEHTMLVDLGRNDLGRVCEFKSVHLSEFMKVEMYSHVMHIVSNVCGKLKKNKDIFDALIAAFPAGTVSGAPKVRAMEIIEELEKNRRGPYAGCVGYFSFSGNLDSCITIRTIVINQGRAYVQAGAGIVADSKPEKEFQETINKAKAMLEAIARN
jgi:anthranilate synthase component 1